MSDTSWPRPLPATKTEMGTKIPTEHWGQIRKRARNKGKQFHITPIEAWELYVRQKGRCALSGLPVSFYIHHTTRTSQTASLDRIDSNEHYTIDNIQWVHKDLNMMKNQMTEKRMFAIMARTLRYQFCLRLKSLFGII